MKVKSLEMKYFKKFRHRTFDFFDSETGLAKELIVLVGDNGSGKSTVLQCIASILGTAVKRIQGPSSLEWPGFDLSLAGQAWHLPTEAQLDVEFSDTELAATQKYFDQVPNLQHRPEFVRPSADARVSLKLIGGDVRTTGTRAQYFQFRGREYAKQIVKLVSEGHEVFRNVGTVFWYTEHRTATSLTAEEENGTIVYDETLLRRRLADLLSFHERVERGDYRLRPGQRDLFDAIQRAYMTVFPNRRFEGSVPRSEVDEVLEEPWFFLYDGVRQYEIAEMSGGERAVFPMLFDFANWNIHNSVILIDELELHLHPPMQQSLIRALRDLGEGNQFIITTHSNFVEEIVPPEAIIRIED